MPRPHHLLAITRWLLKFATGFSIFIVGILTVTLLGLLVYAVNPTGGFPADIEGVDRLEVVGLVALAVAGGLACFVLVLFAFRLTRQIVETAIAGDPFVNENARRLSRIGWFLLAINVVGVLTQVTFDWLKPDTIDGKLTFGFQASPGGLLAILLIFVLAQIFRVGSEMRAELEGTV